MHTTSRRLAATLTAMTALAAVAPPLAANPVKSLYTTLEPSACRMLERHEHGNTYTCPGLDARWPVWLAEGDDRTFVSFGRAADKRRAATQTLGAFNTPFTDKARRATIEWRFTLRDGKPVPYATILRFHTSRDGARGDVLVVTRVTADEACQVARIDAFANPNAIALARRVADEMARKFDCKRDPQVIGHTGRSPM